MALRCQSGMSAAARSILEESRCCAVAWAMRQRSERVLVSIASPLMQPSPDTPEGRHPHCHFRGLLRLYSRYGPPDRSVAQGDLCHEASAQPVARLNRSPATGPIDDYPGEILLHFGATPLCHRRRASLLRAAHQNCFSHII